MFFNNLLVFVSLFIFGISPANAENFLLEELNDTQYVLVTPSPPSLRVIVNMQGSQELQIFGDYNVKCGDEFYRVSAIKGDIETHDFIAEHIEYFIFENDLGYYSPVKSVSSIEVKSRETGEFTNHHIVITGRGFEKSLCNVILNHTDMEYSILIQPEIE